MGAVNAAFTGAIQAAVNRALTIAALALRAGDHIAATGFAT